MIPLSFLYASKESDPVEVAPQVTVVEAEVEIISLPIEEEFVFDNGTLYAICTCESSLGTGKPQQFESDGVTVLTGRIDPRDTGACQINTYYHLETATKLGYDIFTLEGNWGYAKHLYNTQGTRPWNASRSCWAHRI